MKHSRQLPFHTRRDAWLEIDLAAIEHNALTLRHFLPPQMAMMAVIKADAYGHGALMVLPTLEASGVSMLGVAAMDEAIQLREAGVTLPILVLGVTPDWAVQYAAEFDVAITVFTPRHLKAIEQVVGASDASIQVHIKVDTGMHRIGVPWPEASAFVTTCQQNPKVHVAGVFSHLADSGNAEVTQRQQSRWQQVLDNLAQKPQWCHLANSAGAWHYPLEPNNMVRVGITLFGYAGDEAPLPSTLAPAMGLKARIVHLGQVPPGEGVSYCHTWVNQTDAPRTIATLPLGYADGVPRGLSNHMQGVVHRVLVPQVGTISMDQLMVDVTDVPDCQVGDVVTLLGESGRHKLTLSNWAKVLGTIEYELMCGLRVRLPKTCVRNWQPTSLSAFTLREADAP